MGASLKLKPRRLANGNWQVNVIDKLSPTGKRQRLEFSTQAAALAHIEELKARRDNLASAPALSAAQLLDAAAAFEILVDHSITLAEAAQMALKTLNSRITPILFKDLFNQFKEIKKGVSSSQWCAYNWAGKYLKAFDDRLTHEISRQEILSLLSGLAESSRLNILKTVRSLFRYAKDLDYVEEIPLRRGDFIKSNKGRSEVYVLLVPKIRSILEATLKHDTELLPLLLIETFCGPRTFEAVKLLGGDIDLLRAKVTVRASVAKTVSARVVELRPCALAWFKLCPTLPAQASIAPWSESELRRRMRTIRYLAGYRGAGAHWTPGALRDAFCSYHLAHFGSIDLLIQEGGHTDFRTTKNHYLGLVTPEEAAEFWNLFPGGKKGKIIKFPKTKAA